MSIKSCYVCDKCNKPFTFDNKQKYIEHLKKHARKNLLQKRRVSENIRLEKIREELFSCDIDTFFKKYFSYNYHDIGNLGAPKIVLFGDFAFYKDRYDLMVSSHPLYCGYEVINISENIIKFKIHLDAISKNLFGAFVPTENIKMHLTANVNEFYDKSEISIFYKTLPECELKKSCLKIYAKGKLKND